MIVTPKFTLFGVPRTKKNHGERVKRGHRTFTVPSAAHERWVWIAKKSLPVVRQQLLDAGLVLPITVPLNAAVQIYREAWIGDAVGYYQAIADWLEKVGIVENDRQIRSWDRTRLRKDADLPRVEIVLEEVEDEEFAALAASRPKATGTRRAANGPRKRGTRG